MKRLAGTSLVGNYEIVADIADSIQNIASHRLDDPEEIARLKPKGAGPFVLEIGN
jgi:hypothetical protein